VPQGRRHMRRAGLLDETQEFVAVARLCLERPALKQEDQLPPQSRRSPLVRTDSNPARVEVASSDTDRLALHPARTSRDMERHERRHVEANGSLEYRIPEDRCQGEPVNADRRQYRPSIVRRAVICKLG